jgi:3-oxoacyl-[acyl-carrier-protein] synthase-3
MGAFINKIAYYLPDKIITNQDLVYEFPGWNASKIEEKVGIKQRHIAEINQTALDLAYEASLEILKDFDKDSIDFILLCTQSPDYFLPTSACVLQDRLGLKTTCGALDFNLGCSGYIYGLALAKGLINSRVASNVLLVTSETYSKHINKKDIGNRTIFGDGAAATIVSLSDKEHIFEFELGTDGKGMDKLIVPNGALKSRFNPDEKDYIDESGNIRNNNNLYMNGPDIFNFTISSVPTLISNVLKKNHISFEEVDYYIFHQANKYMLDYLRKKIKIPEEKFYQDMTTTGNTVSATIPIALKDSLDKGLANTNSKIVLAGFGVGFSWGACLIII